jgi:hypothetical protein
MIEDPAEEAFTSVVTAQNGNFRIFEGIWESSAFYLQRIVNIIETMPPHDHFLVLRKSVFALLKLSDLVCERAGLGRYVFGNPLPERNLSRTIESMIPALRRRVTFTVAELKENDIALEDLDPFFFPFELRNVIPNFSLTHSPLVHHPLLLRNGQIVIALPAALSVAIRAFVVNWLAAQGFDKELKEALTNEYEIYFKENPPLGVGPRAPILFQPTNHGIMASFAKKIDVGRYLQLIFVLDTLEEFEKTAFAGANPDPQLLGAAKQ